MKRFLECHHIRRGFFCLLLYDKTRVKVVLLSLAKPRIQPAPPLLKALVGQTVTLPCVVQGEPSPEVNWFHNGLPVGIKDTSPFRIQHVSMADKGTYQCVARNSLNIWTIPRLQGQWLQG
uniref:Ig-like domain-containing protein n=1 Tax=Hippocampus comes TaxID=109280 RepID=A0A3Q3E3Y9_HIPCM